MTIEIQNLLRCVLEGQRAIEEQLRDLQQFLRAKQLKHRAADREILEKLLPAIAGAFGSSPVAVRELLKHPVLKAVTADFSGNSRRIGNLFSRNCGKDISGYALERLPGEHGYVLWCVLRVVSEPSKPSKCIPFPAVVTKNTKRGIGRH